VWEIVQLGGQLGLAERTLIRVCNEHIQAINQSRAQVLDLEERLRVSIASEREVEVRSSQFTTSLAVYKARFEHQLVKFEHQLALNSSRPAP
jgi:hypothetical protein